MRRVFSLMKARVPDLSILISVLLMATLYLSSAARYCCADIPDAMVIDG